MIGLQAVIIVVVGLVTVSPAVSGLVTMIEATL